jgi:hypothetical protein
MSYILSEVVTPGTNSRVALPNPSNVSGVKLSNGTRYDLHINGFGTLGDMVIPSGTEYMLSGSSQNLGFIDLNPVDNYGVGGQGVVNLTVFLAGDPVPQGSWPTTIPSQVINVNNTNLINTTQLSGTQVIQITAKENTSGLDNFSVVNNGDVDDRDLNGNNMFSTQEGTTNLIAIGSLNTPSEIDILGFLWAQTHTLLDASDGDVVVRILTAGDKFIVRSGLATNIIVVDPSVSPNIVINIAGQTTQITGALDVKQDTTLEGNATVTGTTTANGNLVANGNTTLGNATSDTVTLNGTMNAIDNAAGNYFTLDPTAGVDVLFSKTGKTAECRGQLQVDQNLITSAELFINSGSLHFRNSQTLTRVFYGSGTGNGTVTHNAGLNPSGVAITYNAGATVAASPAWNNASVNQINVFANPGSPWTAFLYWS